MKFYYILFFILSATRIQFCSSSNQQTEVVLEVERRLLREELGSFVDQRSHVIEPFDDEREQERQNCQTKAMNCCLACVASVPCCLYVFSCFMS
jgi:hypothetical protein